MTPVCLRWLIELEGVRYPSDRSKPLKSRSFVAS